MVKSELSIRIGQKIKYYRKKNKMTQEGLSKVSGVPKNTIARLERGEHHAAQQTLEKLAIAFKKDLADILK